MATQVQNRRGSTAEHSTFTGAVGEVTVDTDKEVVVVHDGTTAGGYPQMRENGSNSALALGSAATPSLKFTGDTNTGIYSPGADQVAISTSSSERIRVGANGEIGLGGANYGTNGQVLTSAGSGAAPTWQTLSVSANSIAQGNTTAEVIDTGSDGRFVVTTEGSERLRVTSTGLVGIGTSTVDRGGLHVANYVQQGSSTPYDNYAWLGPVFNNFGTGASNPATILIGSLNSTKDSAIIFAGGDGGGAFGSGWAIRHAKSSGAGALAFSTHGGTGAGSETERLRIDSSGRLLVGTSSARGNFYNGGFSAGVQLEGVDASRRLSITGADEAGVVILARQRSGSTGGNTILANNDNVGVVTFQGSDGAEFVEAATIRAEVDGTPGANDMPGRLVFSTTADGASSPTERMRINATGSVAITNNTDNNNNGVLNCTHNGVSGQQYGVYIKTNNDQNGIGTWFLTCIGSTTERATIRTNGGFANYQSNNVNLSDRNAKKDISPAAGTWNCIKEWEIVNYRYKDQPDTADLNLGVIAQQVAEICPEVITVFQEAKEATEDQPAQEERLGVKEQQMYWMAIKALQEAQVRIETLEAKVAALESA